MKEIKGLFPIFKALMAILYLILGAAILVFPTLLLPVNSTFGTVFGVILMLYGIVRIYSSFIVYATSKRKGHEEI